MKRGGRDEPAVRSFGWLLPAVILFAGAVGRGVLQPTGVEELRGPLAGLSTHIAGFSAIRDRAIGPGELRVLNPQDYLLRIYRRSDGQEVSVFVAFYGRQSRGASIHSPRNCLPGAGWEPVGHRQLMTETSYGRGTVNRYVIEHKSGRRALVYYWYQGRGRVEANEYRVKWQMLRDALLKRRTDEALVRLVFPLDDRKNPDAAEASLMVRRVADALRERLPS